MLKPGGRLLTAVKAGSSEECVPEFLGIRAEIHFSLFEEDEIAGCFGEAGFALEFLERRSPYDFGIKNERIFAVGRKVRA